MSDVLGVFQGLLVVSQDYCKGEYMGSGFRVQRGGSGQEVRKVRSFAAVTPGFVYVRKPWTVLTVLSRLYTMVWATGGFCGVFQLAEPRRK